MRRAALASKPEARAAAVLRLARGNDPRSVRTLRARLIADISAVVQEAAATALAAIRTPEAVEALLVGLVCPSTAAVASSSKALQSLGPAWREDPTVRAKIPDFVRDLAAAKGDAWSRIVRALALIDSQKAVAGLLAEAVCAKSGHAIREIENELERIDREWRRSPVAQDAIPMLLAALAAPDPVGAKAACRLLAPMADDSMIQPLAKAAASPDAELRRAAIGVAAGLSWPCHRELMLAARLDPDGDVRRIVVARLTKVEERTALDALVYALTDSNLSTAGMAAEALVKKDWLGQAFPNPIHQREILRGNLRIGGGLLEAVATNPRAGVAVRWMAAATLARTTPWEEIQDRIFALIEATLALAPEEDRAGQIVLSDLLRSGTSERKQAIRAGLSAAAGKSLRALKGDWAPCVKAALTYDTRNVDPKHTNEVPEMETGMAAVRRLVAVPGLLTTAALCLVKDLRDTSVTLPQCVYSQEWKISYAERRQAAAQALEARGWIAA